VLRKWWKLAVRNLAFCCGAIWLAAEKNCNIAQLYSPSGAQKPDILENLLPLFWGAQTCSFRAVAVSAIYSVMWEFFLYRCTSTFSPLNYCSTVGFSSNLSAIYTKWCAQTFPSIFGLFAIIDRNFSKIVAPCAASDGNKNWLSVLNWAITSEKRWKHNENRPINSDTIAVQSIFHSSECDIPLCGLTLHALLPPAQAFSDWDDQIVTKNKHHIFEPTAGARSTIFPKLFTVIELVEAIKKNCQSFFDPAHSFSYRVHGKIWPNWRTCGFSVTLLPVKWITSNLKH